MSVYSPSGYICVVPGLCWPSRSTGSQEESLGWALAARPWVLPISPWLSWVPCAHPSSLQEARSQAVLGP